MATSIPPTQTTRAGGGANIIPGDDEFDASAGPGPEVMDAATLIGDKVVNAAGESLGEIEAIMLDVRSGRIAYAVLSFGGFLGMGSKLFAIPWNALTLQLQSGPLSFVTSSCTVMSRVWSRLSRSVTLIVSHAPQLVDILLGR